MKFKEEIKNKKEKKEKDKEKEVEIGEEKKEKGKEERKKPTKRHSFLTIQQKCRRPQLRSLEGWIFKDECCLFHHRLHVNFHFSLSNSFRPYTL